MAEEVYSVEAKLELDTGTFYEEVEKAGEAMENTSESAQETAESAEDLARAMIEGAGYTSEQADELINLSGELGNSEQRQEDLREAIEEASKAEGENSETVADLNEQLAQEEANAASLEAQIDALTGAVQDNTNAQNDNADSADKFGDQAEGEGASLEAAFGKVTEALGTVKATAEGLVAVKVAKWVWDLTDATASLGDNIDKSSQKMGVSAQFYQKWDYVAQHCGTSMSSLRASMKTLANAVESGNEAFERLGLSMEDIENMDTEQQFEAVIYALQDVDDVTERTYIAGQLLGRGATELGAVLNMTSDDTKELKDKMDELGGVMSDDMVKKSAAYEDALYDLQVATQGLKNETSELFIGFNTSVLRSFTVGISGVTEFIEKIKNGENPFASDGIIDYWIEVGNYVLGVTDDVEGLEDSTEEMAESSESNLSELATTYAETYNSVHDTVEGMFSLFERVDATEAASLGGMIDALYSQEEFNREYARNLEIIKESGYGLEDVAESVASMGEDGAQYAAAIANAIQEGDVDRINMLKDAFDGVDESQDDLTAAMAQTTDAFDDMATAANGDIASIKDNLDALDGYTVTTYVIEETRAYGTSGARHAGGLDYVPYNDYAALLHEGERVMTKDENEEYSSRSGAANVVTQPINIVVQSVLDGAVLARKTYKYFQDESSRHGMSLVNA